MKTENNEVKSQEEVLLKAKSSNEKTLRLLEQQLSEFQGKLEESQRQNNELQSQKSRLGTEVNSLAAQLADSEVKYLLQSSLVNPALLLSGNLLFGRCPRQVN